MLKENLRDILTPPAPPETKYKGGIKSWKYKYGNEQVDFMINQILSEVERVFEECLPNKIEQQPKANVVKRSHIEIHNKLLEEIKQNFKKLL